MVLNPEVASVATNYDRLLGRVRAAADAHVLEVAYVYFVAILVGRARDLARRHNLKVDEKGDRALFADLSFKGIIPERVRQECLSALSVGTELSNCFDVDAKLTESDLKRLLELCRQVEELI